MSRTGRGCRDVIDRKGRQLKIAYIVTRADPIGGAQIHVRDLAVAMRDQGHSVVVLVGGSGPFLDDLRACGLDTVVLRHLIVPIRPLQDLRAFRELHAALVAFGPDLIAAHSTKAGVIGRMLARVIRVPVVVTVHGWSFAAGVPPLRAAVYRWIERATSPLSADKTITVSEYDRELALRTGILRAHGVVTVHNGMPDIAPAGRADPGRTPVRLVMVARLARQKDHPTLLRALAGLRDHPWELDLVGEGPLSGQLEALAVSLGIRDRVHFLGQRLDVVRILADAQVSLLVTNWEGFPLSILEAMRAALPVVASAVGGVGESVREGKTGFLVPPGQVQPLRDRLEQLLTDSDLRVRLGAQGRAVYEQHFTLDHTVSKTLAVYRDILKCELGGAPDRTPSGNESLARTGPTRDNGPR
jgi:glycosyltransferase involved in cell wall biosynthesis